MTNEKLLEVRAKLVREGQAREAAKRKRRLKGRLGELLIEAWLRVRHGDEVLKFPDDPATKWEYVTADGKRPDFLVTLDSGSAEQTAVVIDAKLHTLTNSTFWVSEAEYQEYLSALKQWGTDWLFFAVIDAAKPDAFELFHHAALKMVASGREFVLGVPGNPREAISRLEYDAAVAQLPIYNFDPAEAPTYYYGPIHWPMELSAHSENRTEDGNPSEPVSPTGTARVGITPPSDSEQIDLGTDHEQADG